MKEALDKFIKTGENKELITALKASDPKGIFDNKRHYFGTAADTVNYEYIGKWLHRRSLTIGVKQAIEELNAYKSSKSNVYTNYLAIGGLEVEKAYVFENGVRLIPINQYKGTWKKHIIERFSQIPDVLRPTGIFVCESKVKTKFESPQARVKFDDADYYDELYDAKLLFNLKTNIQLLNRVVLTDFGTWTEPPDNIPASGGAASIKNVHTLGLLREPDKTNIDEVIALHKALMRLDKKIRMRIRIALQRIGSSLTSSDRPNRAIDLGVAFEVIFLNDTKNEGELTFRMALRCARLLEDQKVSRELIFKMVKDIYGLRSEAVHSGKISNKKIRGQDPISLLLQGQVILSKSIIKIINSGGVDWNEIVFS